MENHSPDFMHVLHSLEFWALVVNFALLVFVIVRMGRQPLLTFLQSRRDAIQTSLTEAARIKTEAEAKHRHYSERLSHLDSELASLRAEMIKAGEQERDRIVAEAEIKAARLRHDADFIIEQKLKQLRIDLTKEAVEAAIEAAASLIRQQATAADQQKIAQDYLVHLANSKQSRVV